MLLVWPYLIFGLLTNAFASVLLKKGSLETGSINNISELFVAIINPYLLFGAVSYVASFVFYFMALSVAPLSFVQPVLTAGAIIAVTISAALIFGESLTWLKILGITITIIGVILISRSS